MAYVVTEPCRNCKYTDCVEICPTESFREAADLVVIDPETCIDCDACVSHCPVDAIYPDVEVPDQWQPYIALNAELAAVSPVITERRQPD